MHFGGLASASCNDLRESWQSRRSLANRRWLVLSVSVGGSLRRSNRRACRWVICSLRCPPLATEFMRSATVRRTLRERNSQNGTKNSLPRRLFRGVSCASAGLVPGAPARASLLDRDARPLSRRNSHRRYEPYREAWHLLKEKCYAANAGIEHACFRCDCQKRMARKSQSTTTPGEPLG